MAKKKRKKRNKLKNVKRKIATVCSVLIILVVALIFVMYYPTLSSDYGNLDNAITKTDEVIIDKVVTSDLDLLTLIEGNNTIISWESSDEKVISNSGKVTRPSFTEGDKIVKLTATYKIPLKDVIAEVLSSALGYNEKTKVYTVKVLALEANSDEKVELALNSIAFPKQIYGDMVFPNSFSVYSDVCLEWTSSNEDILSNTGKYTQPLTDTSITITCQAQCDGTVNEILFQTVALSNPLSIDVVNIDFNDMALSNKYTSFTKNNVTFNNAKVEGESSDDADPSETGDYGQRYITLKTNKTASGSVEFPLIENGNKLSFSYTSSRTSGVKTSKLVIELTTDTTVSLEEVIIIFDGEAHTYEISLLGVEKVKITFETEYSEDKVSLDDILINSNVTSDDLFNDLDGMIPSAIDKYVILPFTTSYGGSVTYHSNNPEVISDNGVVNNKPLENTTVTFDCIVNYLGSTYTYQINITVKGSQTAPQVQINFIDIGKYGQSDCGESIYIKYEDIDILVDAADGFDSSKKAVTEAINSYLSDGVLDYVIATHPDSDHIGGMPNVFENFQVENLIVFDGEHTSKKYQNFVTAYTNENCNVINIYDDIIQTNNVNLTLSEDVYLEFIDTAYYNADVSSETNGRSIVFMLHAYDTKVLFTGDADSQGAHPDLESNYQDKIKDIDILKVVHHGTKEGTSLDFIKAVDPEVAIICNGNYLGNKHAHPHVDTITNLYAYDSEMKIYCITGGSGSDGCSLESNGSYKCDSSDYMLDRNGTISLFIDNSGYSIISEYFDASPMEVKNTTWWKGYLETINK